MKKTHYIGFIGLVTLVLYCLAISIDSIRYMLLQDIKEYRPLPSRKWYMNSSRSSNVQERPTVFILGFHRTGSSFTGSVLAKYPGAFYLFEPLHGINYMYGNGRYKYATFFNGTRKIITESYLKVLAREELHAWATCDPERLPYERFFGSWHASHSDSLKSFAPCVRKKTMDSASGCFRKVQDKCLAASVRVIKFIRVRMPRVSELLELYPHLKCIHLVRDPRGNALLQEHKVPGTPKDIATVYCKTLEEELKVKARIFEKYPDRIYTLRYENLAIDPLEYTEEMLQFINNRLHLTNSMERYIRQIAMSDMNKKCKYCVDRGNGTKLASTWRTTISEMSYKAVTQVCGDILDTLGYNRFHRIDDVRNLSIPTLVKDIS